MIVMGAALTYIPKGAKMVFAVEAYKVGVYADSKCTQKLTYLSWGDLSPGSIGERSIYVRNEGLAPFCYLVMYPGDWVPTDASNHILLSWNYDGRSVALYGVVQATLTLRVSRDIHNIADFGFNITIFGTEDRLGDLDHDGRISIFDLVEIAIAYLATPSSSNWNPDADLNGDGVVDLYDACITVQNYRL